MTMTMEDSLLAKRSFERGVERARMHRRVAEMITEEFQRQYQAALWEFLDIPEVIADDREEEKIL